MDASSESEILRKNLEALLPEHVETKIAILDANLIVLFVTSLVEANLFPSFKRVRLFSEADIPVLTWLLLQFASVATNAYVLAESSNLANELSGYKRDLWFSALARFASVTGEIHVPTSDVAVSPLLVPFGVTDAALSSLPSNYVLITAEYRLSGHLASSGRAVINFNHFRST